MKRHFTNLCLAAFCLVQGLFAQTGWTDLKPKMHLGWHGQVQAVAVNPSLPNEAYASSNAGMFKSSDGGKNWEILPNFPGTVVRDIAISPNDPRILIATGVYTSRIDRRFGIFRSTDSGQNWQIVTGTFFPITTECPERVNGYEISFAPSSSVVFVGTDCGLLKSTDNGATWNEENHTYLPPAPTAAQNFTTTGLRKVISVLAIDPEHIIVGSSTHTTVKLPGIDWLVSYQPFPFVGCDKINGLDFVKQAPNLVFRADFQLGGLYFSTNYGETWDRLPNQPPFQINVGPMVRIAQNPGNPQQFDLYYGNGVNLYKTILRVDQSDWANPSFQQYTDFGSGRTTPPFTEHVDMQDLAFHPTTHQAMLLASDGGISRWIAEEQRFKMSENAVNGLSGLEVLGLDEVQYIAGYEEIFLTSWHNAARLTGNGGLNWQAWGTLESRSLHGPQGTNSNPIDTRIAMGQPTEFFAGGNRSNFSCPLPDNLKLFVGIPFFGTTSNTVGLLAAGRESDASTTYKVFRNSSPSCTNWVQIANFTPIGGMAQFRISKQIGTNLLSVTIPYLDLTGKYKLARIRDFELLGAVAPPETPAMNGIRSLATNPAYKNDFVWDVNPENDRELIASDFMSMTIVRSQDGGENWTPLPALTSLVTENGSLYFNLPYGDRQVTCIRYDQFQPNRIYVGTRELGVFASFDGGDSWQQLLHGSVGPIKKISEIRSNPDGDLFVSSAGMGLWQWKEARRLAGGFRSPYAIRDLIIDPQTGVNAPIGTIGDPENCPACAWVLAKQGLIKNYAFEEKTNTLKVWATQPEQVYTFAAKGLSLKVEVKQADFITKFSNCAACNTKTGTQEVRMLAWEGKSVKGVAIASAANWKFGDAQIYAKGLQNSPNLPGAIGKSVPENAKIPISTLPEKSASISLGEGSAAFGYYELENGKPFKLKGNGFHYSGNVALDSAMVFLDGSFLRNVPISRKSTILEEIKPNFAPGQHHIAVVAMQNQAYYKAEAKFELKSKDEENIKVK